MSNQPQITVKSARRQMPHSESTERLVFGAVMTDNRLFAELEKKPADIFFSHRHKELFLCMKSLWSQGVEINPVTIKTEAARLKLQYAGTGESAYIAEFAFGVPNFTGISSYVTVLEDYARRRRVIERARALAIQMYEMEDPAAAYSAFQADMEDLAAGGALGRQGLMRFGDAIPEQIEQWNSFLSGRVTAIETGLYELDSQLTGGGYYKGMFHVVGGVPGMGKSSEAIDIAGNAVAKGQSVVYFTLELSREVFIDRFLSPFADVPRSRIAPVWIKTEDVDALTETALAFEKSFFWVDDRSTTIEEMDETLKRVAKVTGGEIDLIIVDYVQKMSGKGNSEHEKIKNNVEYLCKTAKVYNAAVIALSQFKRRRPEDFFARPLLDWFKESGSIGEAARTATVLWQTEEQWNDYETLKAARRGGQNVPMIKNVTISVIKQGEGAEFDTDAYFDTSTMTFGVRQPISINGSGSVHLGATAGAVGLGRPEKTATGHANASTGIISDDQQGNKIWLTGNTVRIKLTTEPEARVIGTDLKDGALRCKRSREKHLHRASQSYGFNWHLVNSDRYTTFILTDERGEYALPVEIVKQGSIMRFKDSGDGNDYELQYFVPLKVVESYAVGAALADDENLPF